ncbi:hypothetical protein BDEG_20719 [Batrachochytrium dendrobatidis JEL423]|uniref:Uncharacterized protein n=1 Tax=Batrachochytrium dendrobatidis (strain JEL423) TaxID=403673 RepID=A0A177W8X9_BATDL|nr:hypothetical protein BDEG_20719 [Batrachochytrium dendrobatidis JEL423]
MDSTIPCVRMNDTEETLTESITSSTVSRNSTQTKGADPSAIRSMLGVKPGNRSGLSSPGELRRMYTVTKQSSMLMGVLKGAGEGISAASSTYNTPNGSDSSVATASIATWHVPSGLFRRIVINWRYFPSFSTNIDSNDSYCIFWTLTRL